MDSSHDNLINKKKLIKRIISILLCEFIFVLIYKKKKKKGLRNLHYCNNNNNNINMKYCGFVCNLIAIKINKSFKTKCLLSYQGFSC